MLGLTGLGTIALLTSGVEYAGAIKRLRKNLKDFELSLRYKRDVKSHKNFIKLMSETISLFDENDSMMGSIIESNQELKNDPVFMDVCLIQHAHRHDRNDYEKIVKSLEIIGETDYRFDIGSKKWKEAYSFYTTTSLLNLKFNEFKSKSEESETTSSCEEEAVVNENTSNEE